MGWIMLDVEGAEYQVIETMDFDKVSAELVTFEGGDQKVKELLASKGYKEAEALGLDDLAARLFSINLGLLLFNLIPAFPMDGGRVLRALMAFRMGGRRATRIAAGIGQTLSLKQKEFIEAARAAGLGRLGVVVRHIIPNLLGPVAVYVTLTIPAVILAESFLSFLGLGVQPPMASLGTLISAGAQDMEMAWWLLVFPSLAMAATLAAFNFIGDGLRDALDPKDR
jgi:ABC-type dipeptide/oligopeptide/nickel transport system permease subunit